MRRRHRRLVIEQVHGLPIIVLPDVFNPKLFKTGAVLAGCLGPHSIHGSVLDMGTGTGVGAVFAARWAERVVAVDINPEAVRNARLNALLHRVEDRVAARQGDLFAPVAGERFDVVLFNPPFYAGRPADWYDHAWRGEDILPRFLAGLPDHLAAGGEALVALNSDVPEAALAGEAQRRGLAVGVVARYDVLYEIITVYAIRRERETA